MGRFIMKNISLCICIVLICFLFQEGQVHAANLEFENSKTHSFLITVNDSDEGEKAKAFIDKMGQTAIGFLSDESLSQASKEKEFKKLLRRNFDIPTIGRFALGKNWRSATKEQRLEYQRLFETMIVKIYAARFNDYQGQNFETVSFQKVGKKDILVKALIVPDSGPKIKVDWRVRNKGGQYKIIDVVIEGVSMAQTQRSDFSSVIQRGGGKIEVLLEHLRK